MKEEVVLYEKFFLQLEPLLRKLTKGPVLHTIATLSRRVSLANAIDCVQGKFLCYNQALHYIEQKRSLRCISKQINTTYWYIFDNKLIKISLIFAKQSSIIAIFYKEMREASLSTNIFIIELMQHSVCSLINAPFNLSNCKIIAFFLSLFQLFLCILTGLWRHPKVSWSILRRTFQYFISSMMLDDISHGIYTVDLGMILFNITLCVHRCFCGFFERTAWTSICGTNSDLVIYKHG